jgi:beta-aspartyl-peptidase (threonine type)
VRIFFYVCVHSAVLRQAAFLCFCLRLLLLMPSFTPAQEIQNFAIAIHGGAGGDPAQWDDETKQNRRAGLAAALERGVELLRAEGAAMDVVEQVVRMLEDDPTFNAGRGCVLNSLGEHELDASIMDGKTLACGAVAGVRRAKNPVSLARRVMSDTRHVLLIGNGADQFAEILGVELRDADYFVTPRQRANWQRWQSKTPDVTLYRPAREPQSAQRQSADDELYLGTVGCVVLDRHGNLAAATSTGGLMGKRWGRVGDSPIIGAGNYANNQSCAVSGTGIGEEFMRYQIAADIGARMRYAGNSLEQASRAAVAQLPADCGGVIAVDRTGNIAMEFNTPGMSRASADGSGRRSIQLGRDD